MRTSRPLNPSSGVRPREQSMPLNPSSGVRPREQSMPGFVSSGISDPMKASMPVFTSSRVDNPIGASIPGIPLVEEEQQSQQPKLRKGPLGWWFSHTVPPEPSSDASFKQREIVRRAQLASILILGFVVILFAVALVFLIVNPLSPTPIALAVLLGAMLFAAYLNRKGRVNIAGLILAVVITLVVWFLILSNHGGISPDIINEFDLLIYAELVVASLLPVNWVFLSAFINSVFIAVVLSQYHRTPLMQEVMAHGAATVIERPIQIQFIVALVLWLWVRSATRAIKRADRAEEISRLQRIVSDQMMETAEQKRQLDSAIQQIETMLEQVANGNLNARIALTHENVLWSIAGKLNNLLSRFRQALRAQQQIQPAMARLEKALRIEKDYQRLVRDVNDLAQTVRLAKEKRQPLWLAHRGTPLEPLLRQLNGQYINDIPGKIEEMPTRRMPFLLPREGGR